MVWSPPYCGRVLRTIVRRNFDRHIEIGEYAVRILASYGFGCEALLSGHPAYDEAGVPAGDEDNFVLQVSSVVFRLGVGENVRADGRKWPGGDRMGAQFALG